MSPSIVVVLVCALLGFLMAGTLGLLIGVVIGLLIIAVPRGAW